MTTTYQVTFIDEKTGSVTTTGKEYKSKSAATRAGNSGVKASPKPITFKVTEKTVTAADERAEKEAASLTATARKKAAIKGKAVKKAAARKAAPAPAKTATATPAKKAPKKDATKYAVAKDAADKVKGGTVLAAILAVVDKPATREEIIAAVVAGEWRPPKSKADFPSYIRGYISYAVTQKMLTAAA